MEVRAPVPGDRQALLDFFARVPVHERTFFKEDVVEPAVVDSWLSGARGRRAVACEDGEVAGYVAVVPLHGWADHVGEVRLVVAPDRRRTGLGSQLARWSLVQALDLGLRKLFVEVIADQDGAIAMFQALGFQAEGLLRDHVRDHDGSLHDLVLLAHPVTEQWEAMMTAGIEAELG